MCGIAGRFHHESLAPAPLWADRADSLLRHRGPDGEGRYLDSCCELVHRRLALIDLSPTGSQPMGNEDGAVQVVFNGEIYNHDELRSNLKARGHAFRGASDTEVLVHLYEEHGASMANLLRGMFAFAIYDRQRRRLLLARDRFGIKPLYYALLPGQCVFASEIKAVVQAPGFKPGINRQACYDFLGLGYVPEPQTAFSEVVALPRGFMLEVDSTGSRLTAFHKTVAQPELRLGMTEAVDAMADRLVRSVKLQSVADVPVAALLSGGMDSSLVVAAHRRAEAGTPTTFNVRFPDARYDETEMARRVSAHCGTDHQTIDLTDWETPPELICRLLEHFDQPFADTSLIPMHLVAQAIRQRGIICALSGDGGDEAFGGYARFWRANRLIGLMRCPAWLQNAAEFTSGRLARFTPDLGRQAGKAIRLARAGSRDSAILISGLSNYLSEEQKAELLGQETPSFLPVHRHFDGYSPRGATTIEELSRRLTENLFAVSLPGDMLRKVDMMSMLAGIEVRVPMLDEDVVELGLQLPHRLKTDGTQGKLVLRALARQWLPAEAAAHPKHGFGIPLDRMASGRFHEMLGDLLLSTSSRTRAFIAPRTVENWLSRFKLAGRGRRDGAISREGLYQRIFILLALELWLRKYALAW